VTQVPQEFYEFLTALESRLVSVIKSVGKIEHSFWRSFSTDMKTEPCENFIDGDLIESFLDLPRETMQKVCVTLQVTFKSNLKAQLNSCSLQRDTTGSGTKQDVTVDELVKIVEDLTRIH